MAARGDDLADVQDAIDEAAAALYGVGMADLRAIKGLPD